jgi:peptidoglycan/xylan/chitin deacetylase (PgdA/CDA1 family)
MTINLLYHDVTAAGHEDQSGFAGPGAARYKLTPQDFREHLSQIATVVSQPSISTISKPQLIQSDTSAWTITFDDGGISACTEIADCLEQHGWRGWFFIATDYIGNPTFCTREQILHLHQRGHVIGSHSCSHPERISNCSWSQLQDEWGRSCRELEAIIGQPVTSGSVPGGFYSHDVARAAAQAGIQILFNSEPTTSVHSVEGMSVLGRYNIYRGMSSKDAAMLVQSPFRRWRQAAFWNVKKVAKTFAGPIYKTIRQRILARDFGTRK